jgi:hypothetical protein
METAQPQKSPTEAVGYVAGVGIGATRSVLQALHSTAAHLVTAALFICWALLLSARAIAAAIYATIPGTSYEMGLSHIGWLLPASAWVCFGAALLLLISSSRRQGGAA